MPTWGDSQRYSVDYSNTAWGSDVDFSVLQAQNVWIRTLYDRHRFVMRANLGWIETGDFDKVPPDLRFFAGGDRSIRGYKYKSISPKDSDGNLKGASKLATGSLEYQYNVTGKWWGRCLSIAARRLVIFAVAISKPGPGSACAGRRRLGLSNSILPYRSATKTNTVYSFISVWGLNYEFMEENKPRRVDFHCGVTGERCVSGRDDDGAASGIRCGEPLGAGAGYWAGHRRLAGLIVKNIRYEQPGVAVNAGEIHLAVGLDCLWRSSLCVNDLALKDINVAIDSKNASFRTGARRGRKRAAEPLHALAHHAVARGAE